MKEKGLDSQLEAEAYEASVLVVIALKDLGLQVGDKTVGRAELGEGFAWSLQILVYKFDQEIRLDLLEFQSLNSGFKDVLNTFFLIN